MNDRTASIQAFQITIPVRSAREAQVVTALAELFLREGSPDRDEDQLLPDIQEEHPYLVAHALGYIILVLQEFVIPDFEKRFSAYWEEPAAELWLRLAHDARRAADNIETVVAFMRQQEQVDAPSGFHRNTPSGGEA
jgi:hypothetical protein